MEWVPDSSGQDAQRSQSRGGGSNQVSISYSEEKRALFLPQEIKELPQDEEIIFYEGCKPIRARKNWFFKDKLLKQRAGVPPAKVKAMAASSPSEMAIAEDIIRPLRMETAGWLKQ